MKLLINDYYKTLSRKDAKRFRIDVCMMLDIDANCFYRRLRMDAWMKLERREVERYIREHDYGDIGVFEQE